MNVITSQDVALIGCCPCQPDACEEPRRGCQSLRAAASPAGFTKPEDTIWKRYAVKSEGTAYSLSESISGTEAVGTPSETTYVSYQRTISANSANVQTYDRLFNASVGGGGECGAWTATMTEECVATGTDTIITRDALFATLAEGEPESVEVVVTSTTVRTLSSVAGERTEEHIAWEAEGAAWDVANPDHEAAIAAWQEDHDDWVDEVAAWELAYQEWIDGGEVGDPPADYREEPVRPADRPTEPDEFYPPCTFKKTTVETINDWEFYVYDDPGGEGLVLEDSTETTSHEYIYGLPTWSGTATSFTTYSGEQSKSAWIEETRAVLEAAMDFEILGVECFDADCASSIDFGPPDPEPEDPPLPPAPGPSPSLSIIKAQHRRGIPVSWVDFDGRHAAWEIAHAAWTAADPDERGDEPLEPTPRSTYELQWDEVFFPEIWTVWKAAKDAFDAATAAYEIWTACEEDCGDEPIIPEDPGAEPTAPSLVASRSWIYAADEWSSWFEIAVPTTPGETRVVNMLVICYRSAALGQKPTAHGEVYEL